MQPSRETEVIIISAGPTGLALACQFVRYGGVGRRPVFGTAFRCAAPTTWSAPAETSAFTDARHERVELQLWRGLGLRHKGQFVVLDLLRSQLHAERNQPPKPHCYLAWNGKHEQTITAHFSQLGTPMRPVRPWGNAPGWPRGKARSVPARWQLTPKRRKSVPKWQRTNEPLGSG
jgi:hypothetical protein